MRWINLTMIVLFVAAAIIFAFENLDTVSVSFPGFGVRAHGAPRDENRPEPVGTTATLGSVRLLEGQSGVTLLRCVPQVADIVAKGFWVSGSAPLEFQWQAGRRRAR
jgi:hypothetical protein